MSVYIVTVLQKPFFFFPVIVQTNASSFFHLLNIIQRDFFPFPRQRRILRSRGAFAFLSFFLSFFFSIPGSRHRFPAALVFLLWPSAAAGGKTVEQKKTESGANLRSPFPSYYYSAKLFAVAVVMLFHLPFFLSPSSLHRDIDFEEEK